MSPGNDKSNNGDSSGCPVAKDATVETSSSSSSNSWASWLGLGGSGKSSSNATTSANATASADGCPVKHSDKTPASLEEAAGYSQDPHPDQKGVSLSTHRMVSSIPRGATGEDEKGPHHQPKQKQEQQPSHWIYPSEQQFFHALRKKGWDHVEAKSIPSVLEIHNTINERTWKQVQEWEQDMDLPSSAGGKEVPPKWTDTDLKLVRFQGRPNDLSPQAFLWTTLLRWNEPPFDRHDWYVQKQSRSASCQTKFPIQRYVIDYYMMPPLHPDMPPTPFVDARPALDSPRAVFQRAWRLCQEELPAVMAAYTDWKARQPRYYDGHGPYMAKTNSSNTDAATGSSKGEKTPAMN